MTDAIMLRNPTKTFGNNTAVSSFDLSVPAGALYGLIGPNGAGKTTLIRMILSILFPDRGDLTILSMLAIVLSFIPPLSSFVSVLRMASSSPPPMWQLWASIVISAVGAYAALQSVELRV